MDEDSFNIKNAFKRFIKPKKTIHTGEEPVNLTIQQQSEEPPANADEKFIRPDEPVKTETDVQVNTPDEPPAPAKRFIHPPTVKTAPLPAINSPEDYILGDGGKYIKVPDDYVDPFAEKTFTFGEENEETAQNDELPADGNTIVAPGTADEETTVQEELSELDGQIRLDGFGKTEPLETIDEEEAEQMVFENRKEKVSRFRLHEDAQSEISDGDKKEEPEEEPAPVLQATDTFEYRSPNDAPRIREELNARRAYQALKVLGLGVIEIILLWMSLSAQFSAAVKNPATHLVVSLLLTLVAAALSKNTVVNGVKSAINRRFGAQSVLTASLTASVVHNLILFGYMNEVACGACHLYNAIAVASLLCAGIGEFVNITQTAYNFSFLRSKGEKQTVCAVENPADAEEIARGAAVGDTNLCYSTPVDFPAGFLTLSKNSGHWDKQSAKYMPWFFAGAGLVFLISWLCQKSFIQAFSGFTALACVFAPLTLLLADALPMRAAGKALNKHGAMLAGSESAAKFADVNGVLLDATDLFPSGSTQLYGLKAFHGMRIDDAILYAAGVLSAANAPLSSAFDQVIEQRREMLPQVETLTYEDGMGISGWIYDNRVLLGNRELMLHHGVEMPPATIEKKYLQGDPDRKPLYMSVAGRLAAMFVVGYTGSGRIASMLGALEENGVCLLLRTSDPNIDEKMISQYFDVSEESVKILSSVGGLIYTEKLHAPREKAPAHIVHNGSLRSFIGAVVTCIRLKEKIHFSMILQALGIGLGTLLIAFFSIFAGLSQIGVFQLLIYEIFWCVAVILSASMRKE